MDWTKRLNLVHPSTADEYEFIERTSDMLADFTKDKQDKCLKYYEKIVAQMDESKVVKEVLTVVYDAICSLPANEAIEYINSYDLDLCEEVVEFKELTIKFITKLIQDPLNYKGYKGYYLKKSDPLLEKTEKGIVGTIYDRLYVISLMESVYNVMKPYEQLAI